jgi:hypothetical protein
MTLRQGDGGVRVSRRLIEAVKLFDKPAYQIAILAELRAETLSKLLHGALPLRLGDPRVLAIAKVVGVAPEAAFQVPAPAEPARRSRSRRPSGVAAASST